MPEDNRRYSLITAVTKEDANINLGLCTEDIMNVPYAAAIENLMGNAAWTEEKLSADHVTMTWPPIEGYEEPVPAWYAIEYVLNNDGTIVGYHIIWYAE